ncbi:MAG: M20/M25/M40 family metallo-hydrolase [Gemmatimonadota bacterium]
MAPSTADLRAAGDEAVACLREMVRFDTTNPPGHELALVRHLADGLTAEGIAVEVLESAPQRASLVARLPAATGDRRRRPLMLLSHLDVVPVEPSRWSHPPFAADLAEGMVWGRGSIDSKLTAAAHLQVLRLCRRLGLPLERDLVMVAAADEELGGVHGMKWLTEHGAELLDAEYVLNEGGGFALLIDGGPVYTCQVAEKGGADIDLVVGGRPGHASVPHGDNAIVHLGAVLQALGGKPPHRVVPSVRAFLEAAARAQARPAVAAQLRAVLDPGQCDQALAALPVGDPTRAMLDAMLRNTCAPTVLQAGVKRNVIPSRAAVQLSGRPLPGIDQAIFLADVRAALGADLAARVEMPMGTFRPGLEFPWDTPLFGALAGALARREPGAVTVPYMQTGGTDARFLRDRDTAVYGFVPMRYEPGMDYFDLCHGHDERVSVDNVHFAVAVLFDAVCALNRVAV